jgi:hypothetical protein
MRSNEICRSWVVYKMTMPKNAIGGNVVCEQREWELIETLRPGYHTLLYSGLKTEQEAEKLARGTAGDDYGRRGGKKKAPAPVTPPLAG